MNTLSAIGIKPSNPGFLDGNFLIFLETLLPTILKSNATVSVEIAPAAAVRNKGDFYSLLNELNIDYAIHYITARVNGLSSSLDYDGELRLIYIPSVSELSSYYSAWRQSLGKMVSL